MSTTQTFFEKNQVGLSILVGALIIAGAILYAKFGIPPQALDHGQTQAQDAAAVTIDVKNVKTDNIPFVGNVDAPVTIAVWFDYQCPFCKQLEQQTTPQVYENYIKTGKVKLVFKDMQFLGPDSQTAALFGRALWDLYPDQFYPWYVAMFDAQDEENKGFGNLDDIKALTISKIPSVDVSKVVDLMNQKQNEYLAAIKSDSDEARTFGINGTPSLIIGDKVLVGPQPYEAVRQLIDAQLK